MKLDANRSISQITRHGKVTDRGGQCNSGGDIVEDAVRTVLGEGVSDDTEGGKGHDGADCPEPVGTAIVDVDIGAEWIVEDITILVEGGIAPFIEG